MRDLFGQGTFAGYCTNVHAGADWQQARANLERYAVAVKQRICPDCSLGIGLWLSERSAVDLSAGAAVEALGDHLRQLGLQVFTLNGFPQHDFHQPEVKHRVYQPDWRDPRRLQYTLRLVEILAALLGDLPEGSISTLPLGWGRDWTPGDVQSATRHLLEVVAVLERLEQHTGRLIHLDLEPEPGCVLQASEDVLRLFEAHLSEEVQGERIRRYLRVCHDICHAAVMFEDPRQVLESYRAAGIAVGKVQISSAVRACFDGLDDAGRAEARRALADFAEPRYLHQTCILDAAGGTRFFEDLPQALHAHPAPSGEWRTHFHVPVYLQSLGPLGTTREDIVACLSALGGAGGCGHFEVETYSWNVLPEALQPTDLAEGISRELAWVQSVAAGGAGC